MQKELSDKEAALEQADALSEEDARHLRMKEAEMKQSTSEMLRLRQQLKETKLQPTPISITYPLHRGNRRAVSART